MVYSSPSRLLPLLLSRFNPPMGYGLPPQQADPAPVWEDSFQSPYGVWSTGWCPCRAPQRPVSIPLWGMVYHPLLLRKIPNPSGFNPPMGYGLLNTGKYEDGGLLFQSPYGVWSTSDLSSLSAYSLMHKYVFVKFRAVFCGG